MSFPGTGEHHAKHTASPFIHPEEPVRHSRPNSFTSKGKQEVQGKVQASLSKNTVNPAPQNELLGGRAHLGNYGNPATASEDMLKYKSINILADICSVQVGQSHINSDVYAANHASTIEAQTLRRNINAMGSGNILAHLDKASHKAGTNDH